MKRNVLIVSTLIITLFILLFIILSDKKYGVVEEIGGLKSLLHIEENNNIENQELTEDNLYDWIFQSTINDESWDVLPENAEILAQINDKSFWDNKINEMINKQFDSPYYTKWEVSILWYWLLCWSYTEYLWNCEYSIWYLNKVDGYDYRLWTGKTQYEIYTNHSIWWNYSTAAEQIVMNDIWNWNVFYNVSDWINDNEDDFIQRYLWKDFKSAYKWDYRDITVVQLLTNNDDWTSNYHLYIVDGDTWTFMYKNNEKIISLNWAKEIIAKYIWIRIEDVKYLKLETKNLVYNSNFSFWWHTYNYIIDAKKWTVLKSEDEIDIWDEKAIVIAIKDLGIKSKDLRQDVGHWHWVEKILLRPKVNKEWVGINAIYLVEIRTKNDRVYTYKVRASDGKILSKQFYK